MTLADSLLELQELTRRLRRDCPWDREQTARTIVPHTVEEAYEVADAANADRPDKLLDELGDLLFQVYFLALLLEEQGDGDLEQAARAVHDKLVRRHPHVFGDTEARTAGRVRENWERIKRHDEGRDGIFHDVPESLPCVRADRAAMELLLDNLIDNAIRYSNTSKTLTISAVPRGTILVLAEDLNAMRAALLAAGSDRIMEPSPVPGLTVTG